MKLKEKILVISPFTRDIEYIQSILEPNYQIFKGKEYKQVNTLLEISSAKLLIIIMMGFETNEDVKLINQIKKENDSLNIAMIFENSEKRSEVFIQDIDAYLIKPFFKKEIELMVDCIFKKIKKHNQLSNVNHKLYQEKENLKKYFSEEVIKMIEKKKSMNSLESSYLKVTALFVDIRNFTSLGENLGPKNLAKVLNLIFTDMIDVIFSHKGSINKIIGDALLTTFGCPFPSDEDSLNAIKCALSLINTVLVFNKVPPEFLKSKIEIGIGLATGMVFAGNIGSYRRMEYTVIGDIVNLASRLQNLTKEVDGNIIIDEKTYEENKNKIDVTLSKRNMIQGKAEKLNIYILRGIKEEKKNQMAQTKQNWRL